MTAAFVEKTAASRTRSACSRSCGSSADTLDQTGRPHIETLTIAGPFNPTGPGDTPSRRRIFVCRPTTRAAEAACARQAILSTLARRAYRRPVTEAELGQLLAFYEAGRAKAELRAGIQRRCGGSWRARSSCSASSAIRPARARRHASTASAISSWRRGCRSSSGAAFPTTSCWTSASSGKLRTPAVLEQQVRRMLADPQRDALVDNFAGQWLQLRNLQKRRCRTRYEFPDFDDNLRQAFQRETELFFESIVREDRSVLDLLTADYTFVNERLAQALRDPERLRQPVPPRAGDRRGAPRAARAGQHPDGDVACRPDVAGRCAANGFSRTCSARRRRRRRRRAGAQGERAKAASR